LSHNTCVTDGQTTTDDTLYQNLGQKVRRSSIQLTRRLCSPFYF